MGSSWNLTGKSLEVYKKRLVLTDAQRDILIGSVLGDGNLRVLKRHACLTISQGERQADYVLWKYKIFRNWVPTEPRREIRIYYKDKTKSIINYRWSTVSHPIISKYYNLFYKHNRKVIPEKINSLLTSPLALAVWYMDDGSRKPHGKGAFFHTECFSLEGQEKLISCLKNNFSLEARLASGGLWQGKRLYRLYIPAGSFLTFRELVAAYMLPSFQYKISM